MSPKATPRAPNDSHKSLRPVGWAWRPGTTTAGARADTGEVVVVTTRVRGAAAPFEVSRGRREAVNANAAARGRRACVGTAAGTPSGAIPGPFPTGARPPRFPPSP